MREIIVQTSQLSYNYSMEDFVSVYELKSKLSEHLKSVEQGESIVVTRNGKPVARVIPFVGPRLILGALADKITGWDDVDVDGVNWLDEFPQWRESLAGDQS